jgi:thiol-disulfide isomerase/thioredoxin
MVGRTLSTHVRRRAPRGWLLAAALWVASAGCKAPAPAAHRAEPTAQAAQRPEPAPRARRHEPAAPQIIEVRLPADAPSAAQAIAAAHAEAAEAGATALVYVGATWCEPCKRFKALIEQGAFDEQLTDLRFLAFDHDAHGDALKAAGYRWRFVPLFALPRPDGRATGRQFGGVSAKDADLRAELPPRIGALVRRPVVLPTAASTKR